MIFHTKKRKYGSYLILPLHSPLPFEMLLSKQILWIYLQRNYLHIKYYYFIIFPIKFHTNSINNLDYLAVLTRKISFSLFIIYFFLVQYANTPSVRKFITYFHFRSSLKICHHSLLPFLVVDPTSTNSLTLIFYYKTNI